MTRTPFTSALVASLALVSVSVVAAEGPRGTVESVTSEVITVLRNNSLSAEQKRGRVEEIVIHYVDFETMSRLILARNWTTIEADEQRAFVEEFKRHLSVTYGKNVETYHDEDVTITGDREEARGDWTVKTRIVRNGPNDILVDYRLRKVDGEWRIIDVIIERVSLVSNFRSQFQGILTNDGIQRLLELLREKNAQGESGLRS